MATSRTRRTIVVGAAAVALVAGLVAAAVLLWPSGDDDDGLAGAEAAATRFARAVSAGRPAEAGTVAPGEEVELRFAQLVEGLPGVRLDVEVVDVARPPSTGETDPTDDSSPADEVEAHLSTRWTFGGAEWTSEGTLPLVTDDDGVTWRARWSTAALDERLADGDALSATTEAAERASILDAAGESLTQVTPVVIVGVEPRRATDVAALTGELARLLGIDADDLAARIEAAPDDQFVEVITLRRDDYLPLRDQLRPLPGTVFREDEQDLTPARGFARALLGTVGPASAPQAEASDGRLNEGDLTGQGGIQEAMDEQLRGVPGVVVRPVRAGDESPPDGEGDGEGEVLASRSPTAGTDVATTLDRDVQLAAEQALADEDRVGALVAIRAGTGEVIAAANAPTGTPANVAFHGRVPPGSTFKVASTLAYLDHGLAVDDIVPCPATTTAGGRQFRNAGGFALGDVPFSTDFARSCNTAFVDLSAALGPDDLTVAGHALGLGRDWDLGVGAFSGSVPATEGPTETAAAAIGQGRLLVSPVAMAGVAATVAAGRWVEPVLLLGAEATRPAPEALDPAQAEALRALMREVVTDGTGSALAEVPGEPVSAKTGTAEYGTDDPPKAHAWVIGFQGDIAFAVFVEGGEAGGTTAAPLAARFLTALAE